MRCAIDLTGRKGVYKMKGYVISKKYIAKENHPNQEAGEVTEFNLIKGGYVRLADEPLFNGDLYLFRRRAEREMAKMIKWDNDSSLSQKDVYNIIYSIKEVNL